MNSIVKRIVVAVVTGAACQAGVELQNNVLSEKVHEMVRNGRKRIPKKGKI